MNRINPLFLVVLAASSGVGYTQTSPPPLTNGIPAGAHLAQSVLWVQRAAEYRALCHQACNIARLMLDEQLKTPAPGVKRAVVVDVDETILDNSPYEARLVKLRQNYSAATWRQWVDEARAAAIPGTLEFLRYAASRGVEVFYITNRKLDERDGTLKNLKSLGFPGVDDVHLLLRDKESGKEARRRKVTETHQILLLMGDNLNDFSDVFEMKDMNRRSAVADEKSREFGRRFIVLPNPMYGDFETGIYPSPNATEEEKEAQRNSVLKN